MDLLANVRQDFPILSRTVYNRPLVYLDNAATTQKPLCVLDAMREEYLNVNANVHRGVHFLSQQATDLHEQARETVRRFINARSTDEIIFTRGTTEGLNLVASSFCEAFMKEGDEVIVTVMEHHSNIVPWQLQASRKGIVLRVVPMTDEGELQLDELERLFNARTRLVSIAHVSNVLGTVNPVERIVEMAHAHGVPVMVDGAQSTPHFKVDVQAMDCDFFVFSGHKMYGPTGIGVLYGKADLLDRMPPYQGGGEMIAHVDIDHATFADLPFKFEAGTPDFTAVAAFDAAFDFIDSIGIDAMAVHEHALLDEATRLMLDRLPGVRIFGATPDKEPVISFLLDGIHHYDTGMLLDQLGIAVRTGHHCAQPLMTALGIEGCVRASFAVYNTMDEVHAFVDGLVRVQNILKN